MTHLHHDVAACGSASTILGFGTVPGGSNLALAGPADLVFTTSTIEPGGSTGWHWHPGPVLVAVCTGTLTRYDAQGHRFEHVAGSTLVEPAGDGNLHMGTNHGSETVALIVTYLVPKGQPLRVEGDAPEWSGLTGSTPRGGWRPPSGRRPPRWWTSR